MGFVFAAMAEFAFILFVNQIQEWTDNAKNDGSEAEESDEMPKPTTTKDSKSSPNIKQRQIKVGNLEEIKDVEVIQTSFWDKKFAIFNGLRLTTKIDLAGFVFFHLSYMVVNFLYWLHVQYFLY